MSTKKWTPAQQNAIYSEGGSLLVSAAAGSGKTAVLVERAVQLITRADAPLRADRLLIVTFTKAAAEELRSRIGVRLEDELRTRPGDIALRRQRLLLRRAFIGTMDAFCQQLVRENFSRLDIPPDIGVGDASLLEQLSQTALGETMEEMYSQPDFVSFSALYGRARSDREAEVAILGLYDFTRTLPHPEQQLARFAAQHQETVPLAQSEWGRVLLAYAAQGMQAALRLAKDARQIAGDEDALQGYLPALAEDIVRTEEILAAVEAGNWNSAYTLLHSYAFPRLATVRGYEGGGKERVQTLRDTVKALYKELARYCFAATEQEFEEDRHALAPLVAALCNAMRLYEEKYTAAKLEEKILDFADFEQLALTLLQTAEGSPTPLAEQVCRRYDAVMVDEYQDTNELQDALYTSLAGPQGDNLFYVGDVKQSIYRFRKANPNLFLDKKAVWFPYVQGRFPAVLTLGHNFRSSRGVIAGVNYIFSAVMSRELGEIEYAGEEMLLSGLEEAPNALLPEAPPPVELAVFEDPENLGDAAGVAQRIYQMVQQGAPVRGSEGLRPCEYGDFCILLRARNRMAEYVTALEALNIPVASDGTGDLLQSPEILPLTAVLAVLDNPGDDVSLAAVLVGPLFHFTPDEVTRVRGLQPRGSLWGALLLCQEEKAQQFVQWVTLFRSYAAEGSVGRLCEQIVQDRGYLSAVAAMEGGAARRENLLRFMGWANEVSTGGRGGLAGFVRLIAGGKGPADSAAKGVPGHVSIMTIHKSKGLEFPVCILADASHAFNKQDLTKRVQMHAELGIGMWLRQGSVLYPTLQALAVRHRIEEETLSEEMRILYVALTRAKDVLLVSFAHKEPAAYLAKQAAALGDAAPHPFLLGRCNSMADWITAAALCHPDADPLLQYTGGAIPIRLPAEGGFAMAVHALPDTAQQQKQEYQLTAEPDEELVQALIHSFKAEFPRGALAGVPAKLSVSAIAKAGAPSLRKRPSFMFKSGLTAAERGTAHHAFMQYADFAAAGANLPGEVARLQQQGFLSEASAAALDKEGLGAFLASALAGRMQAAQPLLREYDFITAIPAGMLAPGLPPALAQERVLVQGIADAVLVQGDTVEIVDYKTDKGLSAGQLVQRYQTQLVLYRAAIEKRMKLPVTRLTIWSFALGCEVDVPIETE